MKTALVALARAELPLLPVFTLGHSLGGLIVARHALSYQEGVRGMVSVSPAFIVGEGVSELTVTALIFASRFFPNLPLIGNKPPPPDAGNPQPPSRKRDIFSYHGRTRLNFAREIRNGGLDALQRASTWQLPVLFQHGTADAITSPAGSIQAYKRAPSNDRSIELWAERRHNLLTDEGWEAPVSQIRQWIRDRVC